MRVGAQRATRGRLPALGVRSAASGFWRAGFSGSGGAWFSLSRNGEAGLAPPTPTNAQAGYEHGAGLRVTALVALAFLALTFANRAIGKLMLFPPAVFTAAWAADLLCVALLGDRFFSLSAETLAVFLLGGAFLSIGGLGANLLRKAKRQPGEQVARPQRTAQNLINLGCVICILGLPPSVLRMKALAAPQGATNIFTPYFWGSVRRASILEAERN